MELILVYRFHGRIDVMNREYEVIQISVYVDAVYTILMEHNDISIVQLVFYSYVLNKTRFFEKGIYTANTKNDIVKKQISVISGDFEGFSNAIPFILKAIHIMNKSGIISVEDKYVHLINKKYKSIYAKLSNFEKKAITESKRWSDKRFIKEVLHCV